MNNILNTMQENMSGNLANLPVELFIVLFVFSCMVSLLLVAARTESEKKLKAEIAELNVTIDALEEKIRTIY